jgi:hypothetical protein
MTFPTGPEDFLAGDGAALSAWQNVDLLSFRAYSERGEQLLGSKAWDGPQPVFTKLWWQSENVPRHERSLPVKQVIPDCPGCGAAARNLKMGGRVGDFPTPSRR